MLPGLVHRDISRTNASDAISCAVSSSSTSRRTQPASLGYCVVNNCSATASPDFDAFPWTSMGPVELMTSQAPLPASPPASRGSVPASPPPTGPPPCLGAVHHPCPAVVADSVLVDNAAAAAGVAPARPGS